MCKTIFLLICFLGSTFMFQSAVEAQEFDAYSNPNPFLGKHYRENKSIIEDLAAVALDETKPTDQRVKSLEKLHDEFSDASIAVLAKLVHDLSLIHI